MPVILGLAAAVGFGVADFLGGYSARRCRAAAVVATSQSVGLLAAAVFVLGSGPGGTLTLRDGALSGTAGVLGVTGLVLFYRGLAGGRMSVVAPTSALVTAALPILWGVAGGERPHPVAGLGIILGLLAVAAVTRTDAAAVTDASDAGRDPLTRSVVRAAASGVAFGWVLVLFSETTEASGYWPVLIARGVAVPLVAGALAVTGRRILPASRDAVTVAAIGLLDLTGNALFLAAVRRGLTSVVAAVTSLYPAATVLLARTALGERLSRLQVAGVGLALVSLALIGAGSA